ncbi:hypothetical protein D3C72_2324710 [compost metagenome]
MRSDAFLLQIAVEVFRASKAAFTRPKWKVSVFLTVCVDGLFNAFDWNHMNARLRCKTLVLLIPIQDSDHIFGRRQELLTHVVLH